MRDTNFSKSGRLAIPLAVALAATAVGAGAAMAQDEPAYAGLDKDLTGTTIKMAAIGGWQLRGHVRLDQHVRGGDRRRRRDRLPR